MTQVFGRARAEHTTVCQMFVDHSKLISKLISFSSTFLWMSGAEYTQIAGEKRCTGIYRKYEAFAVSHSVPPPKVQRSLREVGVVGIAREEVWLESQREEVGVLRSLSMRWAGKARSLEHSGNKSYCVRRGVVSAARAFRRHVNKMVQVNAVVCSTQKTRPVSQNIYPTRCVCTLPLCVSCAV